MTVLIFNIKSFSLTTQKTVSGLRQCETPSFGQLIEKDKKHSYEKQFII